MSFDLTTVGGRAVYYGNEPNPVWNFGWTPVTQREDHEQERHIEIVDSMPNFNIVGESYDDVDKAVLWQFSKMVNNGEHFKVFRQITGSCVGNGGGQAVWYLEAADVALRGDTETVKLPFYLLPYGRSRMYSGMRGRGEGSSGSGFAEAIRKDGTLPFDENGLPQPDFSNGITWGRDQEYKWSDGDAVSSEWLNKSRKFVVKTTAQVNSANDVRDALKNGYPCTIASNWGGQMRPQVTGNPAVLLNRKVTTWNHQMCIIGWWKHPELGDIFYILNSWGPDTFGIDPSGGPPGGFWVKAADVDSITRQGDSFAFSQWDGFPSQRIDWYM